MRLSLFDDLVTEGVLTEEQLLECTGIIKETLAALDAS